MDAVLYIHGKNGSASEAEHYGPLFPSCEVIGLEYRSSTPWEAGREIHDAIAGLRRSYDRRFLIANSIGAFFSMHAGIEGDIDRAYFISPVVDMEKWITETMRRANVTELELQARGTVPTDSGDELSWEYLCYVRSHPDRWNVPTELLYGSRDSLTSAETIRTFVRTHPAGLTVMEGGEHWFHTPEQMRFLDAWIREKHDDHGLGRIVKNT